MEIYYHIGLEKEAKNYAAILGYNYNSSEWFKRSYKFFDKNYKDLDKKFKKENKDNIFKRVIKIFK